MPWVKEKKKTTQDETLNIESSFEPEVQEKKEAKKVAKTKGSQNKDSLYSKYIEEEILSYEKKSDVKSGVKNDIKSDVKNTVERKEPQKDEEKGEEAFVSLGGGMLGQGKEKESSSQPLSSKNEEVKNKYKDQKQFDK